MNTQTLQREVPPLMMAAKKFQGLLRAEPKANAGTKQPAKPCVLHIDSGVHAGAQIRLAKTPVRLGSAPDNDVVLRDPGVMPHHAELRRVDGQWSLFVVEGTQAFPALTVKNHGAFVRQRHTIGASGLVLSQSAGRSTVPQKQAFQWERVVAPVLFAVAAVVGAGAILHFVKPVAPALVSHNKILVAEGWPDVRISSQPNMGVRVTGYVENPAALTALQSWLSANGMAKAEVVVRVGDELTNRVREALGDSGLRVNYIPGGKVRIEGNSSDMALRSKVQLLAADLSGVVAVEDLVVYDEAPPEPKAYPLPVRIVSLSPGEQGSFTTDSGARYFVGGILSDGAEVTAVLSDGVAFKLGEKNIIYPLK